MQQGGTCFTFEISGISCIARERFGSDAEVRGRATERCKKISLKRHLVGLSPEPIVVRPTVHLLRVRPSRPVRRTPGRVLHKNLEYTAKKFSNPSREIALMASNAVEPLADKVPADDFQALEQKVYRTIEMYKAARQAQAAAERDTQRLRQQLQDREDELVTLRRDTVQLKKEREEIRGRVEKMLEQIESIAEAS